MSDVNESKLIIIVEKFKQELKNIKLPFPYEKVYIKIIPGKQDQQFLLIKKDIIYIQGDRTIKSLIELNYPPPYPA